MSKIRGAALMAILVEAAIGIIATAAFAYAQATSSSLKDTKEDVGVLKTEIAVMKQSICFLNANVTNIAQATKAPSISDPNCTR